jgi:lipid-A-disaccharide synthase
MKLFVIAGEPSGDLHASNVMKEILRRDSKTEFMFTGGQKMEQVCSAASVIPLQQMAFMGFVEVVKNLSTIRQNFKKVKQAILQFQPDALLLVDYPGFNLRMAKWASEKNIPVYYYISPTVWAWKEKRVEQIRQYVKKLLVILPFEEAFYAKHQLKVYFVGHPLLDAMEEKKSNMISKAAFLEKNQLSDTPIIAILPGSRIQEVKNMLEVMTGVKKQFPSYQFVIAGSENLPKELYLPAQKLSVQIIYNQTYELMHFAEAGIIKSGTSTLECALFELPQVVCYKTGNLSFSIAKKLVNIKYISLVNLILDKPAVKELVQSDFTSENICNELTLLLTNESYRQQQITAYKNLYNLLGGIGASDRAAELIYSDLNN